MSELAITLPSELMARVAKWATENQLSGAPEALVQLIERGLLAPPESPRRNRGHPVHWGDGRYILLEGLVFQIKRELEHKNGPGKPRVSDEQAIKALRKRYPDKWGVYPEKTLVARFYDARRRLHEICIAYDHDAATTDWGDSRYMLLEGLVFQIKRELEHKNGPGKPRVSDEQAIKALRKRYPDKWGVYPEKTLVARFYDARRRLHEICIAYDHDAATTDWGDSRYMLLEDLVFQIKRELEHKNGPGKPRVSDEQAIKALRKRYPDKWGVYPEKTLVARFYDARRRLHEICIAYDHDAATTGNQD